MFQTRDQPNEKMKKKCKNEQQCLSVGYLTRHKKSAGFWKGVTPIEVGVLSFEKIPSFLKKNSCDTIGGYLPEDIMKKNY